VAIGTAIWALAILYFLGVRPVIAEALDELVIPLGKSQLSLLTIFMGVVTKVSSRYVVVRSGDGIEAIVPNETLVTTTVLNHTYTSSQVRIAMPIQIAFDSDVDKALDLLNEVALGDPRVLRDSRAPAAVVLSVGDSGIALELGVWVDDPHVQGNLKSVLYRAILKAFAANDIRIPFPQRDVRVVAPVALAVNPDAPPAQASESPPPDANA
jgi:small-conductance mechanosensitive channel